MHRPSKCLAQYSVSETRVPIPHGSYMAMCLVPFTLYRALLYHIHISWAWTSEISQVPSALSHWLCHFITPHHSRVLWGYCGKWIALFWCLPLWKTWYIHFFRLQFSYLQAGDDEASSHSWCQKTKRDTALEWLANGQPSFSFLGCRLWVETNRDVLHCAKQMEVSFV